MTLFWVFRHQSEVWPPISPPEMMRHSGQICAAMFTGLATPSDPDSVMPAWVLS